VFEKKVLRKISGPKRQEITGIWRKFNNEELHNLYFSQNIIRVIKLRDEQDMSTHSGNEKCIQNFTQKI
jgi:hypothetical protein